MSTASEPDPGRPPVGAGGASDIQDQLRQLAPHVLAALMRRHDDFEAAEDAVQEALLAASTQWPAWGVPYNPSGWLVTVASRRMIDQRRSEQARRRREEKLASQVPADERLVPGPDTDGQVQEQDRDQDDTLILLLMCCHPSLRPASQIALTLRAVCGLTTAEIAQAFLVPETTMAQRISRARQRIKAAGARFQMPPEQERLERLGAVLRVLYLIFNEGYTATSGPTLSRPDLTADAIRLARTVYRALPGDGEAAGLLALMLLVDARRPARTRRNGSLVPLAEQDRSRWNRETLDEGITLITHTLARAQVGPYQLQAAIAAVHSEAARAADTDWPQIVGLYQLLEEFDPSPMVMLSHTVAIGMVEGPQVALARLEPLEADKRLSGHHRLHAVRAHLLEMAGERQAAMASYRTAARLTTSLPEQDYLRDRASRLAPERHWDTDVSGTSPVSR